MKRSFKLLFAFLFIPLALLTTAELVLRLVLKVPKGTYHRTTEKTDIHGPSVPDADMVFIGDSRVEWGFKPQVIQDALSAAGKPLRCVNLAMPGSSGIDVLNYLEKREIYPKYIVIGYTGAIGRYVPFKFAVPESELKSHILSFRKTVLDYLQRNFIVCELDQASIKAWRSGHPAHYARHEYDEWGGVNVWINGNYQEKKKVQTENYTLVKKYFNEKKLLAVAEEFRAKAALFASHGTRFITVRMPTTPDLYELDPAPDFSLAPYVKPVLDMNFNEMACSPQTPAARELLGKYHITPQNELTYMIDGSHLSHEMSATFSNDFARFFTQQLYSGNPVTSSE